METEQQQPLQQGNGDHQQHHPSAPLPDADDSATPPRPPPRLSSQSSTSSSKMITLAPQEQPSVKPERPAWFRIAYVFVGITITGILTAVLGTILFILRVIKVKTGSQGHYNFYYFGRKVPKHLGVYLIIFGIGITFFGWLGYHTALIRIDRYINALQDFNSKKKRDARELGPAWTEEDPLMEQDEDDYYEKKRKEM